MITAKIGRARIRFVTIRSILSEIVSAPACFFFRQLPIILAIYSYLSFLHLRLCDTAKRTHLYAMGAARTQGFVNPIFAVFFYNCGTAQFHTAAALFTLFLIYGYRHAVFYTL